MNATCIQMIWSVEGKLADQQPVTKAEGEVLLQLIHESYGSILPQKREVINAQEAERLRHNSATDVGASFFESKFQSMEKKYNLSLSSFHPQI